ncbi:MAG: T9SS C-terminal target domain-containing protein [Calditrichaeota bacterium]|nr:MAG: T9SS C-terminal target domain-containing protein [Calditrichota bacterium]
MKHFIKIHLSALVLSLITLTNCFAEYEEKIVAADAANSDLFGGSVSISGDYAIIGARQDDDTASASGSAYIFIRSGASWTQQAKLNASDPVASHLFGGSVSISGDYAIVGAIGDNTEGSQAGAAYIFVRSGTSWTQQAKLTASDAAAQDFFGHSVSISGDYAIIGAYSDDDDGALSGSAYIFVRSGTSWNQQAKLNASDNASLKYFGYSVAIDGEYAAIGAYLDNAGDETGSAYIFKRSGTSWAQQAKITASDAATGDRFGRSISISGDYVIVGADRDDDGDSGTGSAYIFNRSGTSWTQQAKINASDAATDDEFGSSVSISEDYAVVGTYQDDDAGFSSGSAYVFKRSGTSWTQQTKLTSDDGAAGDDFGFSVAINGNYIISGTPDQGGFANPTGAAYIYGNLPIVNADVTQTVDSNTTFSFNDGTNEDTGININFTGVSNSATIQCQSYVETPADTAGIGATVQPIRWVITDGGLTFTNAEIRIDLSALPFTLDFPYNAAIFHRPTEGSGTFTQLATTLDGDTLVAHTNSFSEFTIVGGDGSLPVELTSFEAESVSNGIKLLWRTETETNNLGFKIYRSTSEKGDFQTIASHSADENLRGQINSTFSTNYNWTDTEVETSKKYFYYIADINLDGMETTHKDKIVSVTTNLVEQTEVVELFILAQNFPNPFNPSTTINYEFRIANYESGKLAIFNVSGEKVKEFELTDEKGSVVWDGTDSFGKSVSSGTYFYKLTSGAFTKTNKMILLK